MIPRSLVTILGGLVGELTRGFDDMFKGNVLMSGIMICFIHYRPPQ